MTSSRWSTKQVSCSELFKSNTGGDWVSHSWGWASMCSVRTESYPSPETPSSHPLFTHMTILAFIQTCDTAVKQAQLRADSNTVANFNKLHDSINKWSLDAHVMSNHAQCLKGIVHRKICSSMKIVIINPHQFCALLIFSMQNKRRKFMNVPQLENEWKKYRKV